MFYIYILCPAAKWLVFYLLTPRAQLDYATSRRATLEARCRGVICATHVTYISSFTLALRSHASERCVEAVSDVRGGESAQRALHLYSVFMGCCASRVDASAVGALLSKELKLDATAERDLIQAYRSFKRVDANGDGRIQKKEFADAFKLTHDVFLDRLFMLLDADGTGFVDFREFVVAMGSFHLSNSTGRVRFAFRLLDLDDNGSVSKEEFCACIKASVDMFQRSKKGQQRANENDWHDKAPRDVFASYKDLFAQIARTPTNSIKFDDFTAIVVKYPKLFAPVNFIWNNLRKYAKPCGELCKVVARAGHHGFFHGTMLENGWPGVKFYAPSWELKQRNVYMRSLSNLFKRRGNEMDRNESMKNMESNRDATKLPPRTVPQPTRRTKEGTSRGGTIELNSMLSPARAPRIASSARREDTDHHQVGSARDLRSYADPHDSVAHHKLQHDSATDISAYAKRNREPAPARAPLRRRAPEPESFAREASWGAEPEPESFARETSWGAKDAGIETFDTEMSRQPTRPRGYRREFSWGDEDPDSETSRREILASNSMEKAYKEDFGGMDHEPEAWLEDDIQKPSSSGRAHEKNTSIEEIWNALNDCPSAYASRVYAPTDYVPDDYYQRLDEGVYFKKNYSAARSSGQPPPLYVHERHVHERHH